jgi:hypothetical protein
VVEDGCDGQSRREAAGLDDLGADPRAAGARAVGLPVISVEPVDGLSPDLLVATVSAHDVDHGRLNPQHQQHGGQVGLPAVVEELLVDVAADGFMLYCCGPKTAPNALVAYYEWDHYVDLLTIRDFDRVTTARVPTRDTVDIFAPEIVVWSYEGPPQRALRALLDLVHPGHPDAPTTDYPAPASLHVPRAQQRPMTIQPPHHSEAGCGRPGSPPR